MSHWISTSNMGVGQEQGTNGPRNGLSFSVWNYTFGEFSFWPTVGSDFDQPESALRPGEDAWEGWWMLSPCRRTSAGRVGSFQLIMGMRTPRNMGRFDEIHKELWGEWRNMGIRWGKQNGTKSLMVRWKCGRAPCFVNLGSGRLQTQYFAVNDMSRGNATENIKTLL